MAINTAWKIGANGLWGSTLDPSTQRLAFSGDTVSITPISVDAWNPATIVTDSAFASFVATANNCRYVDPTHVQIDQDGVDRTMTTGAINQTDCTVKVTWEDTTKNTVLTNCKFYAYNGSNPITAPTGVVICAFEHYGAGIGTHRFGGSGSDGYAWNENNGIGGSGSALKLENQSLGGVHSFYIGISAKPTVYGSNTNIKFRVEFDVS